MCVFFICIFIYLLKPIHYHNPLILHNEIIIVFSCVSYGTAAFQPQLSLNNQ